MTKTPLVGTSFFGLDPSQLGDRFWGLRRQVSKRFLLLEFGPSSLSLAEASLFEADVQFGHVRRFGLPDTAVERGVPREPAQMASLIRELCKEEKIYAHRAAVVLPPEAAFTKVVDFPAELSVEEARHFAHDPTSGLQIPIPLQQTDFDLVPTALPVKYVGGQRLKPYILTSVPQKLVDQLLDTLQQAELELHRLDLGFSCQLRLMAADAASLEPGEYLLLLELLPDCTHLTIVAASGPVALDRLAAVREFLEPVLNAEQADAAMAEALSAEAIALADDRYLPISELDVRVLVREVGQAMQLFGDTTSPCRWKGVALTGINSAHPLLADLLAASLSLPVHVLRPMASTGVGSVVFSQLLVHQSLGRLLGLGLGMLPLEALVACSLSELADHHSFDQLDAPVLQNPQQEPIALLAPVTLPAEVPDIKPIETPEQQVEVVGEWPSITAPAAGLADDLKKVAPEFGESVAAEEDAWPSLELQKTGPETELSETESRENLDLDAEQEWPSIATSMTASNQNPEMLSEVSTPVESSGLGRLCFDDEDEWPSIASSTVIPAMDHKEEPLVKAPIAEIQQPKQMQSLELHSDDQEEKENEANGLGELRFAMEE